MNKSIKRCVIVGLFVLAIFGAFRLYYHLTDDFRISNITYELPFEAPWKVPLISDTEYLQIAQILDQKFTYLGKGAQSYAFGSDDQQYVLKFFKFKHLKPSLLVELLPPIPPFKYYKQQGIDRKQRKLIGVFNGYDLAFRENRKNAELIYLHLLPTNYLKLEARLVDKMGFERLIQLDDVVFLIQRKGETLRVRLNKLLQEDRLAEVEKAIDSIVAMYVSEYQKGIYDHDHGVLQNSGFIGDRPFHLDVGKLNKDERMRDVAFYKKDLEHVLWKIDFWIKNHHPRHYQRLTKFLAGEYEQRTGESLDFQSIDPARYKKKR